MRRETLIGGFKSKGARRPSVHFATGSPLGALSAWPTFALQHHLLVQRASRGAGREGWYTNYAIVGDDLVIGDSPVAESYLALLDLLCVKTSTQKSVVSRVL